jgi:uncharacterized protein
MSNFIESRYTISIELNKGRTLLYNSLTGAMALLEEHEKNIFDHISQGEVVDDTEILNQLVYGGFIVSKGTDEKALLEKEYRLHRYNHTVMTLTIAPTMLCNFACDYCYQGKEKASGVMSQQVQDAIVKLVRNVGPAVKQIHGAWYGGEPLLQKGVIKNLSEHFIEVCDQRGINYDATMVTNGYLLTPETIEELQTYRLKTIQVTFDGPPAQHDKRRILHSGEPTFERIVKNISDVIDKTSIIFSIRVNIDSRNSGDIDQLFDALVQNNLADKTNFKIYFSPIEAMTMGCHEVADVCVGKQDYGRQEVSLYRLCIEKGLSWAPYPNRFHGACAAVKPKGFVILPNGDIHKCWHTVAHPDRRVGTVFDPESIVDDETYNSWLDWNPFELQQCRQCKLLPTCTGSCGYKFLYSHDTRGEAASLPCISWRYNINERLVLRAEKSNVITQDDYDADIIVTDPEELVFKE